MVKIAGYIIALVGVMLLAQPSAFAEPAGDPVKGIKVFKKCKACHTIEAGKKKAGGPNLLGVMGRQAGTLDYKYGKSIVEAGEQGLLWTEEKMFDYLRDPKAFLATELGVGKASVKSRMAYKLKAEDQRADIIAYLVSLSE